MGSGSQLIKLILRILLLLSATGAAVFSFINHWYLLCMVAVGVIIAAIFLIIRVYNLSVQKVAFMFNSIENDDFTFRFTLTSKRFQNDRLLNMSLNRIKDLVLEARQEVREREKYFETILNHVTAGIVIINEQGIVFHINKQALALLGLYRLTHIRQLSAISEGIDLQFSTLSDGESRMVKFFNETAEVTLNITATHLQLQEKSFKIIALTDIADDVAQIRMESWHRMSRVLPHEIMNSLAPITSLSQSLLNATDAAMIRSGLEIINETSKGLTKFVENYRSLTRIPPPVLEEVDLKILIENEINLIGSDIKLSVLTPDTLILADRDQISQVIMNLLKNAVEAVREIQNPEAKIWIEVAHNSKGCLYADICNSGLPISDEIRENLFVPFFTTKETGNGIGLPLSHQIMLMHEGSLQVFTKSYTRFRMQF
jgi:nitrogen fixation/metabolism regulation signal transduction histidine kinase